MSNILQVFQGEHCADLCALAEATRMLNAFTEKNAQRRARETEEYPPDNTGKFRC